VSNKIDENNKYTKMQKSQYNKGTSNHIEHNANSDYWNILLEDLKDKSKWKDKNALDFACGKGRNVINIHSTSNWNTVDGVDISFGNIEYCKESYKNKKSEWFLNNGVDLEDLKSDNYDFVMSTIALQHIPVYDIRRSLLSEILRVMKTGAIFSFQVTYGKIEDNERSRVAEYFNNIYNATTTNSGYDFRVENESDIVEDLKDIGFKNVKTRIRESFSDYQHPHWIYIRCEK